MKIKSLLLGMMTCAALVACTNNDIVEKNDGGNQLDGNSFVRVSLVAPGGTGARALGDFEDASKDETGVTSATFLFLDGAFKGCADPFTAKDFKWNPATTPSGAQLISDAIIVINNDRVAPSYIVAVLNPTSTFAATTSLQDLQNMHADYKVIKANEFVMSNSVYAKDGKTVAAVPVEGKVFGSKNDAMKEGNAIIIPVERVVAKVGVSGTPEIKLTDASNTVKVDGKDLDLTVSIDGWQILENKESRLVKSIDPTMAGNWWNDANEYRSYWAIDYTGGGRTAYKWTEIDNAATRYAQETIGADDNTNPYLLVKATIQNANGTPISLVEYAGQKMTEVGFLTYVANTAALQEFYTREGSAEQGYTYTSFTSSLLEMKAKGTDDYSANAVLTEAAKITQFYTVTKKQDGTVESAKEANLADVEKAAATVKDAFYWNRGAAYYSTPIEQHIGETHYYGIVRNHVYKIALKSLIGFGTPVADPDKAIDIPETPDPEATYLSAQIQILKWKTVNQDAELH